MAFNGSGTFNLASGNPVVSGTVISSSTQNTTLSDIATGLSNCVTRDGQSPATADLPLGSHKITGLADGASANHAASLGQVQSGVVSLIQSISGADTITGLLSPSLLAYAAGQTFRFVSAVANTGAVTLNINSLGAKSITKLGTTALTANDIPSGAVVEVIYDGTQFQLIGLAATSLNPANNYQVTNLAYTGTLTGGTGIVNIGSNQIYKDAAGNVGIGKVPSVLLDVNGSVNTGNMQTGNGVSTGAAFIELGGLRSGAGISYIDFHSIAGGDFEARIARQPNANGSFDLVNTSTGNINIFQTAAAPIVFSVSSVEKARFDSSGYLLVGTAAASGTNLLQVNSDALINGLTVGRGLASVATNTAFGVSALSAVTTGNFNTGFGYQALRLNDTGIQNTAFGNGALSNNTSGSYNTAIGVNALLVNTTGTLNAAVGINVLGNNTTGQNNNGFGYNALQVNTLGAFNNAFGRFALTSATTSVATLGTITGGSGYTNGTYTGVVMTLSSGSTAGTYPTATIVVSGGAVTTVTITSPGSAFKDTTTVLTAPAASIGGTGSGFSVPVATLNTASFNTAVGDLSSRYLYNGTCNTTVGASAGQLLTNALTNTFIGYNAGGNVTTGSNNVVIGSYTGAAAPISNTGSNYIVLSDGAGNVRQVIDSSGNTGFGATAPSQKLQVTGGNIYVSGGQLITNRANASADTTAGLVLQIDATTHAQITTPASSTMAMYTGGTERMRIFSSGGVSIGNTTDPGATNLSVAGAVNGATMQYDGVAMPRMVLSTAVATTSGTSIDFTGLPSWVKKITVMFNGVSTTPAGTNLLIQIGAGSVTTTGYVATAGTFAAGPSTGVTPTTSGFNINVTTAGEVTSGTMTLCLSGSNLWISSHSVKTGTAALGIGGGNITLGGALDRVRLTTLNGTDTFDAGSVNILYEG